MDFELRCVIGADHPSLPGHFPGHPIVPGVVILDEVLSALGRWRPNARLEMIRAVKFLMPLKPAEPFDVGFAVLTEDASEIGFRCRSGDRLIAEGRLHVQKRRS